MQRQEVFVRSRPPDLIFRPLLAGSLSQKHYTTRWRSASQSFGLVPTHILIDLSPDETLFGLPEEFWGTEGQDRGMVLVFHQQTGNFTRMCRRGGEGSAGGMCLKLHWVHLKTKNMSFFFFCHCVFLQKQKKYKKKKKHFVGKLWKRWALSVHAALHASPRLTSVGAKSRFQSFFLELEPEDHVSRWTKMALKGSHQVKWHKSWAHLAFGTRS